MLDYLNGHFFPIRHSAGCGVSNFDFMYFRMSFFARLRSFNNGYLYAFIMFIARFLFFECRIEILIGIDGSFRFDSSLYKDVWSEGISEWSISFLFIFFGLMYGFILIAFSEIVLCIFAIEFDFDVAMMIGMMGLGSIIFVYFFGWERSRLFI